MGDFETRKKLVGVLTMARNIHEGIAATGPSPLSLEEMQADAVMALYSPPTLEERVAALEARPKFVGYGGDCDGDTERNDMLS